MRGIPNSPQGATYDIRRVIGTSIAPHSLWRIVARWATVPHDPRDVQQMPANAYCAADPKGLTTELRTHVAIVNRGLQKWLRIVRRGLANICEFRSAKPDSAVTARFDAIDTHRALNSDVRRPSRQASSTAGPQPGNLLFINAGQTIAADGSVIDGLAIVDESIVTGQLGLVIRSTDVISAVLKGSRVLAGKLTVRVSPRPDHPPSWWDRITAASVGDLSM